MGATLPKLKLKTIRLPRLIPQETIPDELIKPIAHQIWVERERKGQSGTADDDWSKAIEFLFTLPMPY